MNPSFSLVSRILQTGRVVSHSDLQAHFKEIHKNRSHAKKLKLSIRSENKKYSEWFEKGLLGSNESWVKNELFDLNEGNKEKTSLKNFFPCEEIRFKKSFSIHCFLLFIVSFFAASRNYLQYHQQPFSLFLSKEVS